MDNDINQYYTNARLKSYPVKTVMQVASAPIFPLPGYSSERPYAVPPPGMGRDHERSIQESKRRARAKVKDIALCNPFEYFFTWTLDGSLIDRYDPEEIYAKVRSFLGNAVQRKDFSYVLVPEYHKKKDDEDRPAIHMHGLCSLGTVPIVRATSKAGKPLYDNHGRPVYNMPTWTWGFSTCVPIDKMYERTINYLTKYITKDDSKIFGKWYLSSRNLVKEPELIPLTPIPYDSFKDEQKLQTHEQYESEVYTGLNIISEDFPPLGPNP